MKNKIIELIKESAFASTTTFIGSFLALIHEYSNILKNANLKLVFIDILIAAILLIPLISITKVIWKEFLGFKKTESRYFKIVRNSLLSKLGLNILYAIIVFCFFIQSVSKPLTILKNGKWSICGAIELDCKLNNCIYLLDKWKRPISDTCYNYKDKTGFFQISNTSWFDYKPYYLSISCSDENVKKQIYILKQGNYDLDNCDF